MHANGESTRVLEHVSSTLAVVEASALVRVPAAADSFDRAIDNSVIKIRAAGAVSLQAVEVALAEVVAEMALEKSQFKVDGHAIGESYTGLFNGAVNLASARVSKFMKLQRRGSVSREVAARDASGASHRLCVDVDKNLKQVKTEAVTRRLFKILRVRVSPPLVPG